MNKEKNRPFRVLVVCMGNICRSPTGEAVLRKVADEMSVNVEVDSAGTIGFHKGNLPDPRSMAAGKGRGYDFTGIVSRQVTASDFNEFDYILAADRDNLRDLKSICPKEYQEKLHLFLSFGDSSYSEIPDPYYGEGDGFELVLDLIEQASRAFLEELK